MSDLIPWYLVELRSRLAPFLEPKLVETIVGETKSHLKESVSRLESEQHLSEDQATSTALGAYGSPETVALSHLKEHAWRPFGIKPVWLVVGGAFTATTCWMLHWQWLAGYWDNFGETWQNGVALAVCFLATVVFGIGCYAGKRRFRAVTVATCAAMMLGLPFLYSFWLVGSNPYQALSRIHLSRDVLTVKRTLGRLNRMDNYLVQGQKIFAKAKSPADLRPEYMDDVQAIWAIGGFPSRERAVAARFNEITIDPAYELNGSPQSPQYAKANHFVAPVEHGGVGAMVDGRLFTGLVDQADFSHAVLFWRRYAPEFETQVAHERARLTTLLAAAAEARNGRLFFFDVKKYDEQVTGSIPSFLIILLIVEAGSFFRVRSRRRRPEFVKA